MPDSSSSWWEMVEAVQRLDRPEEDWLRGVIEAAFRLRRELERKPEGNGAERPEAIHGGCSPSGTVSPLGRAAQGVLRLAAIRLARTRADSEPEFLRSRGLLGGRWSLLDYFQGLGRRYVLAVECDPRPRGCAALSLRERQILMFACLGYHNKLIAYELGITHSTVKVLLSRAAAKLGVSSRDEMVRYFAAHQEAGR